MEIDFSAVDAARGGEHCAPDQATFDAQRAQIGQWFQGWTEPERQGFFNRLLTICVPSVSAVDDLSAALGGVGMGSWGGSSAGIGGFGGGSPVQQQIEASIGWMVLW